MTVSDDGRVGVANSDERYALDAVWGDGGNDVYLIDALTGANRVVRDSIDGPATAVARRKYVTFYTTAAGSPTTWRRGSRWK